MDLDIMASVQEQIIGNCLCVLGDAMAMPIGSMIAKFRDEFEAHIEAARGAQRARPATSRRTRARARPGSRGLVPRPEQRMVTFTIDGREVTAPENTMLVDAAKYGDVEIPVFCYEPKLGAAGRRVPHVPRRDRGHPEAADRLLDAGQGRHGRPHADRPRASEAQEAVVEFLLINHPLDCPVCDKGGECPLQDISFGWGGGRSRFIEPKRHFDEAARALAADRDRPRALHPLLPLRALQPGGLRGLPARPRRSAARTRYVATFDGHPYVAPFSGNIIELCPVGALTSQPYRFRARPWDIEGSGSVCTLCPAQCNVELHRPRRARPARARRATTTSVDDGWLCDKGRFAYQAVHVDERITQPLVRDGGELRPVSLGARARRGRGRAARAPARDVGALAGGETTNEEGFLLAAPAARGRSAPPTSTRAPAARCRASCTRALAAPGAAGDGPRPRVRPRRARARLEPVDDAPILDLRIRKGVRRNGVQARRRDEPAVVARPQRRRRRALRARRAARRSPPRCDAALGGGGDVDALARGGRRRRRRRARARARCCAAPARTSSILYGERLTHGAARRARGARAAERRRPRSACAAATAPACSRCPPARTAAACARSASLPNAGPGLRRGRAPGARRREIAAGRGRRRARPRLPAARRPAARPARPRGCGARRSTRATTVIAHAASSPRALREHATVVFPAESYAEKEGTVTHPDGRLQRLRPAIAPPGRRRAPSGRCSPTSRERARPRPRRAHRRRWPRAQLVDAVAVLRRAHARRDRRRAACAGRSARQAAALARRPTPARSALEAPPRAPRGQRRAAPRHVPLDLGRARGRAVARAEVPAPRASASSSRPPTPSASASRTATASTSASNGDARRARPSRCAAPCRAGTVFLEDGVAADGANALDGEPRGGAPGMNAPLADVGYYEPWWIQILKSRRDLRDRACRSCRSCCIAERKLLGPLPAPLRPQPRRPVRRRCSRWPTSSSSLTKEQFRPRTAIGFLFALAPVISILTAVAAFAIIPFGDVSRHLRHARSGSTASTSRSAPLYVFAFGAIAFYGIMLGGWACGSKYSFLGAMRAAAQLISYEVAQGLALVGVRHDRAARCR